MKMLEDASARSGNILLSCDIASLLPSLNMRTCDTIPSHSKIEQMKERILPIADMTQIKTERDDKDGLIIAYHASRGYFSDSEEPLH